MKEYTFTAEHLKRLSESHLGQIAWNKGKHLSPNHKRKLAKARSNWITSLSQKERKNIGFKKGHPSWNKGKKSNKPAWNKGKPWSEKIKKKIKLSLKGKTNHGMFKKGHKGYKSNLGKKFSVEQRRNMSLAATGKHLGKNNWNWKGGISKIDKLIRCMIEYKQWRSDVFQRDNWTCQTCQRRGGYITAHHIKAKTKIIKENKIKTVLDARKCLELWDINNGITLCDECHKLTDNYGGHAK